MATEEGIVFKLGDAGPGTAWVKTTRSSACAGCSSRDACHAEGGGKEMEVEAINTARARVGDRIVLNIKTSSLLKATFLLYVFSDSGHDCRRPCSDKPWPACGDPIHRGCPPCSVFFFSGSHLLPFASWAGFSPKTPVTSLKSSKSGERGRHLPMLRYSPGAFRK